MDRSRQRRTNDGTLAQCRHEQAAGRAQDRRSRDVGVRAGSRRHALGHGRLGHQGRTAERRYVAWPADRRRRRWAAWLRVEIGSAACRERGCQYVKNSVVAVVLKKKRNNESKRRRIQTISKDNKKIRIRN